MRHAIFSLNEYVMLCYVMWYHRSYNEERASTLLRPWNWTEPELAHTAAGTTTVVFLNQHTSDFVVAFKSR